MSNNLNQRKPLFYGLALLFAVWGILGMLDIKNYTYLGYETDGTHSIKLVKSDSPAEKAGLKVGDHLKSIDGILVTDLKTRNKQARPIIGQSRTFVVERAGKDQTLTMLQAAQPQKLQVLNYLNLLVGILFLLSGLWIFSTSTHTVKLAFSFFAIIFATAFINGPYIANGSLRGFIFGLRNILLISAFPLLVNFLLAYPPESKMLSSKSTNYLLLVPAILYGILFFGLNVFLPETSKGLLKFLSAFQGLVVGFYFIWALWILVQKYRQSSPEVRQQNRINLLLVGAVMGLLPVLIMIAMNVFFPKTVVPGADYVFLGLAGIPILFALAIKRLESTETATDLQMSMA